MKNKDMLAWVAIFALVVVGLAYWVIDNRPSTTEIQSVVRPLPALGVGELKDTTFSSLTNRQAHGTQPVPASPVAPPRNDPFSD